MATIGDLRINQTIPSDALKTIINQASAYALDTANAYTDDEIAKLSNTNVFNTLIVGDGSISGTGTIANGEKNIVYTDYSHAEGEYTTAGTNSYRVISGDMTKYTWTLKTVDGLQLGMKYSVRLLNNYDMLGEIVSIDRHTNTISVTGMPWVIRRDENLSDSYLSNQPFYRPAGDWLRGHPTDTSNEYGPAKSYPPNACFNDFDFDANTLWIVGRPDLGDLSTYSTGSHSEGYSTCAQKQYSHAEGLYTIASGKYSHSEGMYCQTGYGAHAEGVSCIAARHGSHAEGYQTSCLGRFSHSAGRRSLVKQDEFFVYCWQGDNNKTYQSHGEGTFNINPKNGINGFYIGENTLADVIKNGQEYQAPLLSSVIVEQLLRIMMNPTDEVALDNIWKGNIYEMNDGKKRVFYSDLSGLSKNGTGYAFPFWHQPPQVNTNPKAHLVGIHKLDERISAIASIKAVDTPPLCTAIQQGFNGCGKLMWANFENIESINDWSFSGCRKLSSINVPNAKQIGNNCFNNCNALSSVSLPSAIKIGNMFLNGCYQNFTLDFSQKVDGIVPTLNENAFENAPSGLSVYVPGNMLVEWRNAPIWKSISSKIYEANT